VAGRGDGERERERRRRSSVWLGSLGVIERERVVFEILKGGAKRERNEAETPKRQSRNYRLRLGVSWAFFSYRMVQLHVFMSSKNLFTVSNLNRYNSKKKNLTLL